jgi:hypothetical protein
MKNLRKILMIHAVVFSVVSFSASSKLNAANAAREDLDSQNSSLSKRPNEERPNEEGQN